MSEEIIKVFDYIGEKFGIAIDWTQENLQPYLMDLWERFIKYELVVNIVELIISCGLLSGCLIISIKFYKALKYKLINNDADGLFYEKMHFGIELTGFGISALSVAIVLGIFSVIFGMSSIMDIIELSILPEKYVLEIIQNMK